MGLRMWRATALTAYVMSGRVCRLRYWSRPTVYQSVVGSVVTLEGRVLVLLPFFSLMMIAFDDDCRVCSDYLQQESQLFQPPYFPIPELLHTWYPGMRHPAQDATIPVCEQPPMTGFVQMLTNPVHAVALTATAQFPAQYIVTGGPDRRCGANTSHRQTDSGHSSRSNTMAIVAPHNTTRIT